MRVSWLPHGKAGVIRLRGGPSQAPPSEGGCSDDEDGLWHMGVRGRVYDFVGERSRLRVHLVCIIIASRHLKLGLEEGLLLPTRLGCCRVGTPASRLQQKHHPKTTRLCPMSHR